MLIAAWSNFLGANLQLHPKRLPDGIGVSASNLRRGFADLRPWKAPATVVTTGGATPLISLYRMNRMVASDTATWLQWTMDVDVVRSLIPTDPTEEIYYTGDGFPKVTDNVIGLPAAPGPAAWRTLGIPKPPTAMATPTINVAGTAPNETRVYVDTFINDRNRESAPGLAVTVVVAGGSTMNGTGLSGVPSGNHGIDRRRIYCSTDGGDFLLVVEQAATLTTWADNLARGEVLQSGGDTSKPAWLEPPTGLKGLIALWNNMIGGFVGKYVAVCVPGKPWAWPLEYQEVLHDDVVATGKWQSNWLVLTTSTPVLLRGGPVLFDKQDAPLAQACIAKRSVVSFLHGVCWAGPSGLCYVGQGANIVTEGILSKEQWEALNPASIIGTRFERYYVGFYNDGQAKGFMIDPLNPQGIIWLTFGARGQFYDPISDRLYLQNTGNVIQRWNHGSDLTASFKTNVVRHQCDVNPAFAMLVADVPVVVQFKLWANILQPNGARLWTLVVDQSVTTGEPFQLPSGYMAQDFQVQVDTTGALQGVMLAEAIEDFA